MIIDHTFRPNNDDGWRLDVTRFYDPDLLDSASQPVVLIPGYGMNTFILNFHPSGPSLVEYLCGRGLEVWTANLRGQGDSKKVGGNHRYGFRELGLVDFPVVRDLALSQTKTEADKLHAVGCSLGATVLYAYLAHQIQDHELASMTAIGGPLRWEEVHPLVEIAFKSPALASIVPIRGTRLLARAFLPVIQKFPRLLSIYMNADQIDLSKAAELVKTVDNPNPYLNYQIARWVNERDLVVGGLNITDALAELRDLPILCVLANADGIVPAESAKSICSVASDCPVDVLEVGSEEGWYAHADLFVSEKAQETVFEPMAEWLLTRN
jgi:alpha-beta hydrolase superfamily lysophospholipase